MPADVSGPRGRREQHDFVAGARQSCDESSGEYRGAARRRSELVGGHQHSHWALVSSLPGLEARQPDGGAPGGAPRKMPMRRAHKNPMTSGIHTVSMR